jgi:hypothetical protein
MWRASAVTLPPALTAEASENFSPVNAVTDKQMLAQITSWRPAAVVAVTEPDSGLAYYLSVLLGQPVASSGEVIAWRVPAVR